MSSALVDEGEHKLSPPSNKDITRNKPMVNGGRYLPPALKRAQQFKGEGSQSTETEQRERWITLKKLINGPVNKVNTSNIKDIIVELFSANLIRGRGLFCRSIMRAQALSSSYTPVYAAMVAVINTKLPIVGELLVTRLVLQFRRSFNCDDKDGCISAAMFLAHLANQRIAHEVLAFQVVSLLLETPTDDSVEVAVTFMRGVGAFLAEAAPRVVNAVFDTFRSILHEGEIDKRIQYMIEVLFEERRKGFKDHPIIPEGLDLVDEDEQIVHEVSLDDDDLDAQDELNVFSFDESFEENEQKYAGIAHEILGSESGSGNSSSEEEGSESEGSDGNGDESDQQPGTTLATAQQIHDLTETEKINLRRTIYLTLMSSLSVDEAAHKLLQIEIHQGEEQELCNMVIESCSQERTYKNFFGLIGERLCKLNRTWANGFTMAFASCYENIHRYETGHLRNIAHFFAHLLITDALRWTVFQAVELTEAATTSSSRIFLKIVLQDMAGELGMEKLNDRLKSTEVDIADAVKGMFPRENAQNIRFAINYYTSIGLGAVTEEMREWVKAAPALNSDSDSDSDSDSSSSTDSSGSGSDSSSTGSSSYSSSTSGSEAESEPESKILRRNQSPSASRKYKPTIAFDETETPPKHNPQYIAVRSPSRSPASSPERSSSRHRESTSRSYRERDTRSSHRDYDRYSRHSHHHDPHKPRTGYSYSRDMHYYRDSPSTSSRYKSSRERSSQKGRYFNDDYDRDRDRDRERSHRRRRD